MDEKNYWVGFNLVKGIGAKRMQALLDYFGSAETAWKAPPADFLACGLNRRIIENIINVRSSSLLESVLARVGNLGIHIRTWQDDTYPRRLLEIDQSPPVLYLRGEVLPDDDWAVAIVGTRRATAYGKQVAEEVASSLARSGVTIVSGLARGIDAIAHQAAIQAGGRTLTVLGSGVDQIYPPEHRGLAENIIQHGAILSDYPPGTQPEASNFPPRNRIISGLSRAVIVVEAGQESGAMITAAFAAEQGREVFAVPGSIFAVQSKGTNLLIQQGARPLLNAQDLLSTLKLGMVNQQQAARRALPADAVEAQLFALLGNEPLHVDEIRTKMNLPVEKVSATLVLMELKGMVRQVGGMHYVSVHESRADYVLD